MPRDERLVDPICISQTVSVDNGPREGKSEEESSVWFSRADHRDQDLSNDYELGSEEERLETAFITES